MTLSSVEQDRNNAELAVRGFIESGAIDPESAMFYSKTSTVVEAMQDLANFGIQNKVSVPKDVLHWPTIDEVHPRQYFHPDRDGMRSAVLGRIVGSMSKKYPRGQVIELPIAQPVHAVLFTSDEKLRQDYLLSTAKSICWSAGRARGRRLFPVRIWVGNSGRRVANKLELLAPFADGPDDLLTPISASRGFVSLRLPQEFYSGDLSKTYGGHHIILVEDLSRIAPAQLDVIVRAVAADPHVHLIAASEPNIREMKHIMAPLRHLGVTYKLFGRMDHQEARWFGGDRIVPYVLPDVLPPHQVIMPVRQQTGRKFLRAWIPNPGV